MVLILIKSSYAFTIHNQALKWLSSVILQLDGLTPYPEALSARINSRTDAKTIVVLLLKENPIKQKRFSRAILSSDGNHSHSFVAKTVKKVFCILTDEETCT